MRLFAVVEKPAERKSVLQAFVQKSELAAVAPAVDTADYTEAVPLLKTAAEIAAEHAAVGRSAVLVVGQGSVDLAIAFLAVAARNSAYFAEARCLHVFLRGCVGILAGAILQQWIEEYLVFPGLDVDMG